MGEWFIKDGFGKHEKYIIERNIVSKVKMVR